MKNSEIGFYVLFVLLLVLCMELLSGAPDYRLEPATVTRRREIHRKVFDSGVVTEVRFDDGYSTEIAGALGDPGSRVLAYRRCGTVTLFGVIGSRSLFSPKPAAIPLDNHGTN